MATIVVETGSGTDPNANSYVSVADATTYATDRGYSFTNDVSQALIKSMDYIESLSFIGNKNTDAQPLQWPRYGVVVDSYSVGSDEIPQLLIDALCECALGVDGGNSPIQNLDRTTKREKVGELEVEYEQGTREQVALQGLEVKLQKLLKQGFGMNAIVGRA